MENKEAQCANLCALYLAGLLEAIDPSAEYYKVGRELVEEWRKARK